MRWVVAFVLALTGFGLSACELYDQSLPVKSDAGPDAEPEDAEADADDGGADGGVDAVVDAETP